MSTTIIIDFDVISSELLAFRSIDSMLGLLGLSQDHYDEVGQIMSQFKIDWDNAECNPEGPTKEQDEFMDSLLLKAVEDLQGLLN